MNAIDDRLGLMFACCHPALGLDARIALTLQALGELDVTLEIADAFLVPPATMAAQRLVQVKRKIRDAAIPFDVPPEPRLAERLDDVCSVTLPDLQRGLCRDVGRALGARRAVHREAIRLPRACWEP